MVGWDARGANGFAIDPKNANHVLGNRGQFDELGPQLGAVTSWPIPVYEQGRVLDTRPGPDRRHFWARWPSIRRPTTPPRATAPARTIWRTTRASTAPTTAAGRGQRSMGPLASAPGRSFDGGGGFASNLKIGPDGTVYAGGNGGLFRSRDRGRTFENLRTAEVDGLALSGDGGTLYHQRQRTACWPRATVARRSPPCPAGA